MEEGLEVRGGLLEEVDLQPDGDRFRKENVISGEDVENTLDFEAQRMKGALGGGKPRQWLIPGPNQDTCGLEGRAPPFHRAQDQGACLAYQNTH